MTIQATILAALALVPSITLTPVSVEALTSQVAQKGRPRVNGRVTVGRGNLTAEQFSVHSMRGALARELGVADPKSMTHYLRECSADQITFVVPGTPKDSRIVMLASIDALPAASEPAPASAPVESAALADVASDAASEPASEGEGEGEGASESASEDDASALASATDFAHEA